MYLASNGIVPPQQWYCNPDISNNENHTVCYYLFNKCLEIPE